MAEIEKLRRMLGKMGLDMKEMDGIEEVIIKTENKENVLDKTPSS